jgi:hypothetical protein
VQFKRGEDQTEEDMLEHGKINDPDDINDLKEILNRPDPTERDEIIEAANFYKIAIIGSL